MILVSILTDSPLTTVPCMLQATSICTVLLCGSIRFPVPGHTPIHSPSGHGNRAPVVMVVVVVVVGEVNMRLESYVAIRSSSDSSDSSDITTYPPGLFSLE